MNDRDARDDEQDAGVLQAEALRMGRQVPTSYHTVGGRHKDGTPIAIGAWTFQTPQVRSVVESYLDGRVLNACAGRTTLSHDDVHRNDLDDRRDADTHHDVTELDEHLPAESFDVIVFDPPFDSDQAEEHYGGRTVGRGPSGGIWSARDALANLTAPGGLVLSVGWNSVGLKHKDAFERVAVHVFQREQKPDVFLTADRKTQTRLVTDGGHDRDARGIKRSFLVEFGTLRVLNEGEDIATAVENVADKADIDLSKSLRADAEWLIEEVVSRADNSGKIREVDSR